MKWLNFKYIFLSFLLIGVSASSFSQTGYDKRVDKYKSVWESLIPSYTKIQFAGNMGLLSFGTGWDYGKNNQWETDVLFGFVPKYSSDRPKATFTLKQNFIPWNIPVKGKFSFDPLTCGLYMNTVFGSDFWTTEPNKYPSDYYSFSTKIRFNVFVGQRITYNIKSDRRVLAKNITFFYEISSNDLYLVSAIPNSYLKPKDYLTLSFGLKMQIL